MKVKYRHTNIISRDWRRLAQFYRDALGCTILLPERSLKGVWLDMGTGVPDTHLRGIHLRLPGHGADGPVLEIYQYSQNEPRAVTAPNREGIMHLAFEVDSVATATAVVLEHGGRMVGDITSTDLPGDGRLTFVYVADPEGNIIELQSWD